MVWRAKYYRVYLGVITLLATHVEKDSGVASYFLNGLRPVFQSLKSDGNVPSKGHAVMCYSCSSKENGACLKPDTNEYSPAHCDMVMMEQMRNYSKNVNKDYEKIFDVDTLNLAGVDLICLKVVVQEGHKKYVLRGCQLGLHDKLDICKKVEKESTGMFKLLHCSKCSRDACNSAMAAFRFESALILICLVIYQAIFKL